VSTTMPFVHMGLLMTGVLLMLSGAAGESGERLMSLLPCGSLDRSLHLRYGWEYVLRCQLFVPQGHTLVVDAGVTVTALPSSDSAPAIIVEQGGTVDMRGTAALPITFTSLDPFAAKEAKVVTDTRSHIDDGIEYGRRGKWGGIILLGRAPANVAGGVAQVEGLGWQHGGRGFYGGTDPRDERAPESCGTCAFGTPATCAKPTTRSMVSH